LTRGAGGRLEVARTRMNIGDVYRQQAEYSEALHEYKDALHIYVATFGKDHPHVASIRKNMCHTAVKYLVNKCLKKC